MRIGFTGAAAASIVVLVALSLLLRTGGDRPSPNAESDAPIVVYCAAGIRPPVAEILLEYEKKYGASIQTNYAGSGSLLSDIRAGEGDLFLAADQTYLDDARRMKLVRETLSIAHQSPVIAVAKGNPKNIRGIDDLKRDDVQLSLADPKAAAISRVARDLIEKRQAGDWDVLWKKAAVHRGTVNEVANDVAKLGSADATLVWDATAAQYPDLDMVRVPELDESKNLIAVGVVESSRQPRRALHLARYLSARDKGLKVFQQHGYAVVDGDEWAEEPEILFFSGALNRLTVEPVVREFEEREGAKVLTSFNGCGTLVGQMRTGARPDMYFACDVTFLDKVQDLFFDGRDVSRTDIVIITPKGNPKGVRTLNDLTAPGLKIALADSQKSTLGQLTDDLLTRYKILESVRGNVQATAGTADQLVQHIVVGELDAAVVYKANTVHQAGKLEVIPINDPTAKAVQPVAVGRESKHPALAARLMEHLLASEHQTLFLDNGFEWLGEMRLHESAVRK